LETKSRDYLRYLKDKEIQNLKARYVNHVKITRSGFLNTNQKEKLLRITKWGRNSTNQEIQKFFYDIREQTTAAIRDFQLLCEVLNEDQLEKIFLQKRKLIVQETKEKFTQTEYPITKLIKSLIPYPILIGATAHQEMEKIEKEQHWRKYILEDLVIECLLWYYNSGLFETDVEQDILFDAIDVISVKVLGEKRYHKTYDLFGQGIMIS